MSLRSRLLACGVLASVLAIPSVSFGQCQKGQNGGGPGGSPGTFYGPRMSFNAQPRPSQMQIYQLMQQRQTHLLLQQMVQQEIARQQYLVALQQQQILQNLMIHSNARLQQALASANPLLRQAAAQELARRAQAPLVFQNPLIRAP